MDVRARSCVLAASVSVLFSSRAYAGPTPTIGCGNGDSCVVFGGSQMWCWGRNDAGQLGDGTTTERHAPISLGSGIRVIAVGDRNVCRASLIELSTACVGANEFGQIGDGTTIERHAYTPIPSVNAQSQFTAGDTPCATVGGGTFGSSQVVCWGSNHFGSVGDGTATDQSSPVLVLPNAAGAYTSGGGGHTCAYATTTSPPELWCWGNNVDDALGLGPGAGAGAMSTTPVQIPLPDGGPSVGLAVGVHHNCMIPSDRTLWCWGLNDHGQLGDGTTVSRSTPVQVPGLSGLYGVWVSPSGGFTCASTTSGSGYCWGRNDHGQLGDGTTTERHVPAPVTGLVPGATGMLNVGEDHACAYFFSGAGRPDDSVACWGGNEHGQVGDGTTTDRPTPVFLVFSVPAPAVPALGGVPSAALGLALLAAGALRLSIGRARRNRETSKRAVRWPHRAPAS